MPYGSVKVDSIVTSTQTVAVDEVVLKSGTQSLTNKTLAAPVLTTPVLGTPASGTLTSCTGLPISTGVSGLGTGAATFLATPSSANFAALLTDETGTGSNVFATSPTLVTPALGTPSSGTLTSCTGLPISTGVSGLGSGAATFLATPSSVNFAALLTDETGTGAAVFATSPTLVTPVLGTPSSGTLTNCESLPISGLTASTSTALGVGSIELGNASDTTLSRSAAGVLAVEGVVIPSISSTSTLTNKTLAEPRITSTAIEFEYAFGSSAGFEIDPANGSMQLLLLQGNHIPKGTNFKNGQKILLFISDGSGEAPYTIDWTDATFGYGGVEWLGGEAPQLATTGYTAIELSKAFGQVRGALLGPILRLPNLELTGAPFVNGSYRSNIIAVANLDINCSLGNYYTKTITESSTFTFSNIPASRSYSFTLCVTHDSGTITWPASVKWPKNTAPTLNTYKNHKFMFSTYNGGSVFYGAALVDFTY